VGIGPKIAARLLRDHGSVLGIYDALHDLHPKVEAALRASREDVERNLVLMAPIPHVEVDVVGAVAGGCDPAAVVAGCADLGIPWAGARFRSAVTAPPPPPLPPPPEDPDDGFDAVLRDATSRARPAPMVAAGEQVALF
jgi:hypothetical protein